VIRIRRSNGWSHPMPLGQIANVMAARRAWRTPRQPSIHPHGGQNLLPFPMLASACGCSGEPPVPAQAASSQPPKVGAEQAARLPTCSATSSIGSPRLSALRMPSFFQGSFACSNPVPGSACLQTVKGGLSGRSPGGPLSRSLTGRPPCFPASHQCRHRPTTPRRRSRVFDRRPKRSLPESTAGVPALNRRKAPSTTAA
jgi:hypothetical protein